MLRLAVDADLVAGGIAQIGAVEGFGVGGARARRAFVGGAVGEAGVVGAVDLEIGRRVWRAIERGVTTEAVRNAMDIVARIFEFEPDRSTGPIGEPAIRLEPRERFV